MRNGTLFGLLIGLMLVGQAQVREVWRYEYTPSEPDLLARLECVVRLRDGGWLLLGWTATPLNGQDALAIRLQPNGVPAWIYQQDGVGFDDAFVDGLEFTTCSVRKGSRCKVTDLLQPLLNHVSVANLLILVPMWLAGAWYSLLALWLPDFWLLAPLFVYVGSMLVGAGIIEVWRRVQPR